MSYGQLSDSGLCGHATELLVVCLVDIPSIPLASYSATSPLTGTPQAAVHLSSSPFPSWFSTIRVFSCVRKLPLLLLLLFAFLPLSA